MTFREQLEASLAEDNRTREIEGRLRGLIAQRDRMAGHLRDIDTAIADQSRQYANHQGLTVRPSIEQLRLQLVQKARPQ